MNTNRIDPCAQGYPIGLPRKWQPSQRHEPTTIITMALIGAAVGAVTAAVTGGNILKGALFGAIGGAIGGAFTSMAGAAGGGAAQAVTTAGADAAVASAGQLASAGGGDIMAGLAQQGSSVGVVGAEAATGMMNNPSAYVSPQGTGLGEAVGSTGVNTAGPDTSIAQPQQTSMGAGPANTGLGNTPTDTGLGANGMDTRLANGQAGTSQASTSFLDTLLNKGKGMINNQAVMSAGGQVLKGFAQGATAQKQIDARKAEIADGRTNSRFGNVDSRYNTAGMIGNFSYKG